MDGASAVQVHCTLNACMSHTACTDASLPVVPQAFLSRLKYDPCSHVDEFQAYLVTEKANFFGMDLAEQQAQLAAAFAPGSWR